MKKNKILIALGIGLLLTCSGCGNTPEEQKGGEDGLVTMSATVSDEDYGKILKCTLFNKTEKEIVIGDSYSLQFLKDESFVDVPFLPGSGGFNLPARYITPDSEYSFNVDLTHTYGDLESGRYRIVKEYRYQLKAKENEEDETVTAEFDLP